MIHNQRKVQILLSSTEINTSEKAVRKIVQYHQQIDTNLQLTLREVWWD